MCIVYFLQYFLMHSRPFFSRETISTFQSQLITPMKKLSLSMYQLFPKFQNKDKSYPRLVGIKEFFRTCNVLPFSCTHLALWRGRVKDPRYMKNKNDSRISLVGIGLIANTFFRTRKTTFNLEDFEKTAKKIDLRHSLTRFQIDLRLSKPQR